HNIESHWPQLRPFTGGAYQTVVKRWSDLLREALVPPTCCVSSERVDGKGTCCATLKVSWRDPSTVARDDRRVFPFRPLRIAFAWWIGNLRRYYDANQNLARLPLSSRRDLAR